LARCITFTAKEKPQKPSMISCALRKTRSKLMRTMVILKVWSSSTAASTISRLC
jgi:hypothetical protein